MADVLRDASNGQTAPSARARSRALDSPVQPACARPKARREGERAHGPHARAGRASPDEGQAAPPPFLLEMPDEVLVEILAQLDVPAICMLVRSARQIGRVAAHPRVWHTRALRLVAAPRAAWLRMARYFQHVVHLTVEPCASAAPAAKKRHSPFCPLGEPLPNFPHLTRCGGLSDEGLALLMGMLPNLASLVVPGMGHLTYRSLLRVLADSPRLKRLDASGCTHIVEPGLDEQAAAEAPHPHARLAHVDLSRTRISNCGLRHLLPRLPALQAITLNFCQRLDSSAGSAAAAAAAGGSSLAVGSLLSAHAKAHGLLAAVELIGSESVSRHSVRQLEEQSPALKVHTDESFVDSFLHRSPSHPRVAADLNALICAYYSM